MAERKVHLRPNTVINIGHTKTACGLLLYPGWKAQTGTPIAQFADLDATTDRALVTCAKCFTI